MQEVGTIEGVVAAWINNYLSQNSCFSADQLSPTQVRYWPIRSELMLYEVGRSVSVPPPW